MPALSSKTPVAVRQQNRISTSPTRAPPNSMGSNNYTDRGGYREGAPVNSTRNSNNSMYNAMSAAWGKELQYEQKVSEEIQNVTKTKKVAQSPSPRPSTPHGKGKNFIERNKQYVQAVPTSPTRASASVKKSKEDSQSVSPTPGSKPKSSVATQNRPLTPGASNGQSSVRSQAKTDKKTKVTTTTNRRSVSPPASSAQSAHSRSHVHAATNSSHASTGHGHSAHSRAHVRSATPEASLRDEIKKLKKLMMQYEDWLNDKESELLESEDVIDALQERVAQVEARNREIQRENEFLRTQLKEQLEKQKSNEPTKLISSVMSNIQRIRGESAPPVSEPEPHSPTSSSPMSSKPSSPVPESPKPSPVLITSKMRELSKANNINNIAKVMNPSTSPPIMPRVVPKTIKVNSNVQTSTRPTAPSPAVMNSPFNNGGLKRTEMLGISRDRQTAFDRKQAAALNVVMEESDDSEVDEFVFDREDTSDDQTDSSEPSEDETENNTNVDTENESHDDDDDFRWSTRASTKNDLDSIIEEDDEESEFEYEPQQENRQQKNLTPVNPVAPLKNSFATVAQVASAGTASNNNLSSPGRLRRRHLDSTGSSDSGIGSGHEGNFDGQSVYSSSQQLPKVNNSENFDSSVGYPHLDSMSSTKSDSSDDSIISASSSKNNSQSSVTSPSSADISPCDSFISQQNLVKSNGLYDQFISDSTSKSSSYNNGITGTGSNNKSDNPNFGLNSAFNKSVNDNSALNSNKRDINSTSVSNSSSVKNLVNSKRSSNSVNSSRNDSNQSNSRSTTPTSARPTSPASSSRASTPSSNASTARAPSPASPSSSRASTPSSESSRNASSGHNRRSPRLNSTGNSSSSDKCPTDIPLPPSPPPPPPASKDPLATLQHYLRLISENSVMENPLKAYDIKKVIDEGSSAKVYNASPLSNPEEDCAIKIVPLTYSLEFIFNEIYVLKNLKHKNIVDFKESFLRWDGKTREVWIAMEKCARGDVTSRAGKVTQREVGRIAGELLNALKHLHHHGVIHRDIKLSNILVDAKNEVKLADFGISSLTPTSTTSMVGTIPYMAPDVVLVGPDRPYDAKADIWSLGVCILELLTGKAAWGRIRDDEIMDKLRKGEMPHGFQRLRKKNEIGWEAVDFLEKCFIKTPENRLSAEELLKHPFITGNHN